MRVSIAGTGYVGLVTGACLAEKGHEVTCVDLDAAKVETINRGLAPIREEGLDLLLLRHAGRGLKASTDLAEAVRRSELTLIAVGTPFDGRAIDLAQVKEAARAIGAALREKDAFHTVVVKSTVVPGTTDEVVLPILERESGKRAGMGFGVGMNPEFLTEGEAVSDFMDPDRLVLGAGDARAFKALEKLYAGFPGVPVVRTNPKTAEMIKYASNTLLATLISWSNELANLSQALGGIDAMEVVEGMKLSRYLTPAPAAAPSGWVPAGPEDSPNASLAPAGSGGAAAPIAAFLVPGCGFGGSCLPKDTAALIAHGKAAGVPMRILEAVRDVNIHQPARMAKLLERRIPDLRGVPVAVLGLAFRPGTGDLRESPAIPIVRDLLAKGAEVVAYDPAVAEEITALGPESHPASRLFDGRAKLAFSLEEALTNVRAVMLITRWPEFRRVPDLLRGRAQAPVVVDGRRLLDRASVPAYEGIGL